MPPYQEVEFITLDKLTLKGCLYPASRRGPGIILTPGFNCVKEMFIPEVAEAFQASGVTALIYDPRSTGASGGQPRNEIDPMKQIEDYSDAATFLGTLPIIDPNCIAFWGMSFSATIALCAAALDKRAKCVIAICPLMSFEQGSERFSNILARALKDREFQAKGKKPFYLPLINDKGDNPAGIGIWADKEVLEFITNARERIASTFESHITIQTYYKMVMWQPSGIIRYLSPTPAMVVVPELDKVSPPEEQIALFNALSQPKKLHMAQGKGHLNVLSGEDFPVLMKLQADWLQSAADGTLESEQK